MGSNFPFASDFVPLDRRTTLSSLLDAGLIGTHAISFALFFFFPIYQIALGLVAV